MPRKRRPPAPTLEQQLHPLSLAIRPDSGGPHIYDCTFGQFHVESADAGNEVSWHLLPPTQQRFMLPCPLQLTQVGCALVDLARGQGRAIRIEERKLLSWTRKVQTVLMPVGDDRLKLLAVPDGAHELPGLRLGTGLLFDGERAGLICRSRHDENQYGLVVWGPFYAVEIGHGFDADPRIPIAP